jgi:hypothetical protein
MYGYNPYLQNFQNNYGNIPQGNNNNPQANNQQDERIYVSNQQAAESYIVAANGFVRLWDSSQPRFYEKIADYTGRPMPMKIYEYKEVSAMPEIHTDDFVSTKDFEEFKNQVNDFINNYATKEVKKNAKQSTTANADV